MRPGDRAWKGPVWKPPLLFLERTSWEALLKLTFLKGKKEKAHISEPMVLELGKCVHPLDFAKTNK